MHITLNKKAVKQISKLPKRLHDAIYDDLEMLDGVSLEQMKSCGVAELKGNLSGLLKCKHKSFSDYRLVGFVENDDCMVIFCCEPRNSAYKQKDALARSVRKQKGE